VGEVFGTDRGHYQQLLLFAGRVASLLRLTGPMRDGIVSLKMVEGILFRDPLGHLVLSATASLLRSCEPPAVRGLSRPNSIHS
jgi:hypothetical protein